MRTSHFTAEQLAAGEELLSAYASVIQATERLHGLHNEATGHALGDVSFSLEANDSGESQPRFSTIPRPWEELAARDAIEKAEIASVGTFDGLKAIVEKYQGRQAHFFPKDPRGDIYIEDGGASGGIRPVRRVSGTLTEQIPLHGYRLDVMAKQRFPRPPYTIEKVIMGGGYCSEIGACTLAHLAIIV